MKLILDSIPIGIRIVSMDDGKLVYANKASMDIFGCTDFERDVAGRSAFDFMPEIQPNGRKTTDMADELFSADNHTMDFQCFKLDGEKFTARITSCNVIYMEKSSSLAIIEDITKSEQMLEEIEYRNNLVFAAYYAAAILLDSSIETFEKDLYKSMKVIAEAVKADRMYIWKNHMHNGELCHTQLYEWSEEVQPLQGSEFTVNVPYSKISSDWEKILSRGDCINRIIREMSPLEKAHLSPQGIVSILIVPLFIKDQFWGLVGFDDCHNERVFNETEESILRSGSLLIASALLRNEMVLNIQETSIQLESALMQAAAASKAKGDFLSTMSHEMRTPMNAIIGMTAIGKKANTIEQKNHALNRIEDASSHLLGVINDVLDMAKIEANKLELAPIEFDFERMLQQVITVINFRLDEKRQRLNMNVDEKIPAFIVGDDQRLAQVITNLLSNAIKFTPEEGEIQLNASVLEETSVHGKTGDHCELLIEVVDNGIGILPDKQEKLFNAFEQAENKTSREYGGTGLGLVISKRIVELMDGRIWVESEYGKGSRFKFTVQVLRGKKSGESVKQLPEKSTTEKYEFKGKRVLIAEDIEINREILIMLLEDTGLTIDCAENGKEAVELITAVPDKYDIILMDLQMPIMDGFEATRRIRKFEAERKAKIENSPDNRNLRMQIPIIAMTAHVFKDDIEACHAAGMNDHIGKPIDFDKVLETLRTYL